MKIPNMPENIASQLCDLGHQIQFYNGADVTEDIICRGCEQAITESSHLLVNNSHYHNNHFMCRVCKVDLYTGTQPAYERWVQKIKVSWCILKTIEQQRRRPSVRGSLPEPAAPVCGVWRHHRPGGAPGHRPGPRLAHPLLWILCIYLISPGSKIFPNPGMVCKGIH